MQKLTACVETFRPDSFLYPVYNLTMDRELNPLTRDYTSNKINTLQNAVYIRLTTPKGSWWADGTLGSLLHLIQREKDLSHVGLKAQQYAEEALKPLVDDGRAKSIVVKYEQPKDSSLNLIITVIDNRGVKFEFKHPVKLV